MGKFESDWVSGFVAHAICTYTHDGYLSDRVLPNLLRHRRPNGGWGYDRQTPSDCDSTAWVLLALCNAGGLDPFTIGTALGFILRHQDPATGGFATYALAEELQRRIRAPDKESIVGWLSPHCCVSAVALQCLLTYQVPPDSEPIKRGIDYLLSRKTRDAVWLSYWWRGYSYTTYHALRAILLSRQSPDDFAPATVNFILDHQLEDGSWSDENDPVGGVFATSFCALTTLLSPTAETLGAARRGVEWLMKAQNRDGSWPSIPMLQIPPANVADSSSITRKSGMQAVTADEKRCFTSAEAIWALSRYVQMIN